MEAEIGAWRSVWANVEAPTRGERYAVMAAVEEEEDFPTWLEPGCHVAAAEELSLIHI